MLQLSHRIKEQQVAFQALKKASGNTFTARGMPVNYLATVSIIGLGFCIVTSNLYKLYNGVGKVQLPSHTSGHALLMRPHACTADPPKGSEGGS